MARTVSRPQAIVVTNRARLEAEESRAATGPVPHTSYRTTRAVHSATQPNRKRVSSRNLAAGEPQIARTSMW